MSGQLQLDTNHLTHKDADDHFATKGSRFSRFVTHPSSASVSMSVVPKLGSCSTSAKISVKAIYAFASLNTALPA